jgi:solute carrier family 19 (thiamine transporter), member 2/3
LIKDGEESIPVGRRKKFASAYALLWKDFVDAFTNMYVVKWSVWWALATCGFLQVRGN